MNIDLSKLESLPTPFYYYDMSLLETTIDAIRDAVAGRPLRLHYALKANCDPRILRAVSEAGFGADCVSGGEIETAIAAGFRPEDIVYAGVGKRDDEILTALRHRIGCINVESVEELGVISQIASSEGLTAPIALRVNPDIDAHTHEYITTGLAENKFGIDRRMLPKALAIVDSLPGLDLIGLHFHIGSQITTMEPYVVLCHRVNKLLDSLRAQGRTFRFIDLGGGLGVDYDDPDANPIAPFGELVETLTDYLHLQPGQTIHIEPGRSVVAQCGTLISRVLFIKHGIGRDFMIVDAGMTDLMRPALYNAFHKIENLSAERRGETLVQPYDVVGPVCESTDTFAVERLLPESRRGDIIAFRSAGAYGQTMASTYNLRPLSPAVYSDTI